MAETASPFLWSGNERLTPEQVQRKRKVAQALMKEGGNYSPVQSWTQGAARVAQALVGGWEDRKAGEAEKANAAEDSGLLSGLLAGATGAPAAVAAPAAAPSSPSAAGPVAAPNVSPDIKTGIVQTAQAIGADPVDLATAISYETGGTFDPTKAGPRTQWGQHRGLIQFGEPQAKQHGVDWSNPVGSQLGPNGAVASYLKSSGFKPGMNFLDLYSTINAGAPGLYNRSDAKNGGAPGTVRDKVEQQMQGHRAKAQALLSAQAQADMPAPDAMQAEAPTGQPGFVIPQGARPVESIPGDDPAKLRVEAQAYAQTNPEAARQMLARADAAEASMAPAPMPPARPADLAMAPPAAPGMTAETFAQIQGGQPLEPVFQSEGVAQPWMGTAMPQAPAAQVAQAPAPMPPPRPADIPAPGAVEAIGQMPPQQPAPAPMGNIDHLGDRMVQVEAEQARQGQPSAPQAAGSSLERVTAAFTGGGQPAPAAAPQSPAVAKVAQAVAQNPGDPLVQALTSPYTSEATKKIAMLMLSKKIEGQTRPQWAEQTLPDGSLAQRNTQTGEMKIIRPGVNPLDAEGKKLDIETKKKNLGKVDAPATKVVKQSDGSEVALQWDQATGEWVPLRAPHGGNAVTGSPSNPFALPGKPTEGQSKDAGFAGRLVESHNLINGLESVGTDKMQTAAGAVPLVGNALSSADKQKFEQAKRNFVTAILRKESGAVISPSEFETEDKKYFPQVGDSPDVIKQKRDARELAIEGVMAGAGSGYKVPESYKPARGQAPARPAGQTKSGVKWSVE